MGKHCSSNGRTQSVEFRALTATAQTVQQPKNCDTRCRCAKCDSGLLSCGNVILGSTMQCVYSVPHFRIAKVGVKPAHKQHDGQTKNRDASHVLLTGKASRNEIPTDCPKQGAGGCVKTQQCKDPHSYFRFNLISRSNKNPHSFAGIFGQTLHSTPSTR